MGICYFCNSDDVFTTCRCCRKYICLSCDQCTHYFSLICVECYSGKKIPDSIPSTNKGQTSK